MYRRRAMIGVTMADPAPSPDTRAGATSEPSTREALIGPVSCPRSAATFSNPFERPPGAALPEQPMTRNVFIVARHEPGLFDYMSDYFAGRPDVQVILDRRLARRDRRRHQVPTPCERRRRRRRVRVVDADLAARGFAALIVR